MQNSAKVVIVGTGAMGSVYAALMADCGHDVWAVDTNADHIAAIKDRGLRVTGASGDRTVSLNATTDHTEPGSADLVIIATKFADVGTAARQVAPIVRDDTMILSVQNGLGGPDQAAEVFGAERITAGVVGGFGASMKQAGHAHHNGMEMVRFGELQGAATARTERIKDIWEAAGFKANTFDDLQKMIWEKLIFNCSVNGPCAVTGMTVGELMADPSGAALSAACATEAWTVAKALKIDIAVEDPVAYTRKFGEKVSAGRPSMAQDHIAKRKGEADAINGAPVRMGKTVGVSAPANQTVVNIIKAREAMF